MTRDEAVTQMRRDLGYNNNLQASILVDALKSAQDSLEREPELPFFLQTEISSISTVIGEERVAVPSDFLTAYEDDTLWIYDATADTKWIELPKHDFDALRRKHAASDNAKPEAYALTNKYIRLFPAPDKVYTLKWSYMGKDTVLSTNVENEWLKYFPELLISLGVKKVAGSTQHTAAFKLARETEVAERTRLRTFIVARETTNYTYQMGGAE